MLCEVEKKMIYVCGRLAWYRAQADLIEMDRFELLKMRYIDQEAMCRIYEIGRHMARLIDASCGVEQIKDVIEKSPLSEKILDERFPVGFQLPTIDSYDGSSDPQDHLHVVRSIMQLQNASDALICRVFATTLRGRARCWYYTMSPGCITEFKTLAQAFLHRFAREKRMWKQSDELWYVQQREGESLKDYMARFNDMASDVNPFDVEVAIACFRQGLRHEQFKDNLHDYPAKSFVEVKERAESYIRREEYDVKTDLSEKDAKKRRGHQYQGGRKKGRAGNSYQSNWGSGY